MKLEPSSTASLSHWYGASSSLWSVALHHIQRPCAPRSGLVPHPAASHLSKAYPGSAGSCTQPLPCACCHQTFPFQVHSWNPSRRDFFLPKPGVSLRFFQEGFSRNFPGMGRKKKTPPFDSVKTMQQFIRMQSSPLMSWRGGLHSLALQSEPVLRLCRKTHSHSPAAGCGVEWEEEKLGSQR